MVDVRGVTKVTRDEPALYLGCWLVTDVLAQFLVWMLPDWTVLGGRSGTLVVVLIGWTVSVVLWARTRGTTMATGSLRAFLVTVLLLWGYVVVLMNLRHEDLGVNALLTPVLLLMLIAKPPTSISALRATDAFAWALVAVSAASLALERFGISPSWYDTAGFDDSTDRLNYWLPLVDIFGIDGRWAGPFSHPNIAGPVGAFLLVYGVTRPGARRIVFAVSGGLILLLTSSRTSQGAALMGLVTLAMVWWLRRPSRLAAGWRALIVALPAVLFFGIVLKVNPNLTGRSEVWPTMVDLWRGSPVFGIGGAGFEDAIAAGTLPDWAHHGHNVPLDGLVRYGLIGGVLVLLVLVLAAVISFLGARAGGYAVGIALFVAILVGGMGDTIVHWEFPTNATYVLILAVLISVRPPAAAEPVPTPPG
jgi:hypothetical protein